MDQPHRARQLDLVGLDEDHLALDAAQTRASVSRAARPRQSITMPSRSSGAGSLLKWMVPPAATMRCVQFRQHAARLDMAFVGEKQRVAKTAFQRGFEFGQRARIEPLVAAGELGKALEIGAVAADAPPPASR